MLIDCPLCAEGSVQTKTGKCNKCHVSFDERKVLKLLKRNTPCSRNYWRDDDKDLEGQPFDDNPGKVVIAKITCGEECEKDLCRLCKDAKLKQMFALHIDDGAEDSGIIDGVSIQVPEGHVLILQKDYGYLGPLVFEGLKSDYWNIRTPYECHFCGSKDTVFKCDGCGRPVCNRGIIEETSDEEAWCREEFMGLCRKCLEEGGEPAPIPWEEILSRCSFMDGITHRNSVPKIIA